MVNDRCGSALLRLFFLTCLLACGVPILSHAQVTTNITSDGTLGTTITPTGNLFNIDGGTIKGANQFHSFGQFSVGTGDIASFNGPAGIQNIISRVTGGSGSQIDGTVQSTISGANLFLMNPSGILFGPNAQLDVSGSFHATTANYIGLADGTRFNAIASADGALLTSAPPSAFGFLTSNPAPIDVFRGGVDFNLGQLNVLNVPDGKTLSFVGGPVNLGAAEQRDANGQIVQDARPAYLLAPNGRVNLVSVASSGEAVIDNNGAINVDSFSRLGDISIKGGRIVVGGDEVLLSSIVDAPNIFVRGGRLDMNDAALFPGIFSFLGVTPPPDGGAIDVKVTGDVNLRATGIDQVIIGVPGGIRTFAGAAGPGDSGNVPGMNVQANSVSLSGPVVIQSDRFGPGIAGDVVVTANTVEVRDGASMSVNNFYAGPGGNLTIDAQDVLLSGDNNPGFTGLAAQSAFSPFYPGVSLDPALTFGDGGTLTVNAAKSLTVRGGAEITTDSFAFGRAGDIVINAGDMSLSRDGAATGAIASQSILAGNAGNISIDATGQIAMTGGFRISATTGGSGDGGTVDVTAAKGINMSGDATGIFSVTTTPPQAALDNFASLYGPGIDYATLRQLTTDILGIPDPSLFDVLLLLRDVFGVIALDDLTVGNAGKVSISTPQLTMSTEALVDSSTGWDGNAGEVQAKVGSVSVNTGAEIRSRSGFAVPDPENPGSNLVFVGTGNAGEVTISAADTISLSGGSISTTTLGNGNAGNISLSANQVNVQNSGSVTSTSGGIVNGKLFVGTGNAGQIGVSAPTLTMADGGAISVATLGAGNAGNIALNVSNFTQTGGARIDSSTSGAGSGGDLTVTATDSATLSDPGTGLFSTASGTGAGGDVNVQAPRVQILNGATMSANSTGTETATAGNVNIATNDLNMQSSSITTGATVADGGNISITTTGSLVHLTDSQITTSVLGGIGNGGNIAVNSDLIVLDDSNILARAVRGHGGNITITGDVFLVNSGGMIPTSLVGIVDASSELSTPGVINIEATFTNVVGTVTLLPETPLKATELLRAACAARFAGGKTSSLVVGGRDGVPIQPGGLLPSPLYMANGPGTPTAGTRVTGYDQPSRFRLIGSKDDPLLSQYSLLPNVKCAL
jgi:filamentous hemagglutinin family protein